MPQKRQQFRFRIPWISGPSTGSQSHPKHGSSSTHPNQRPPFRPPGIAHAPPPQPLPTTQVQGTPISEPQQLSTSHDPPQSPASSVILESPLSSPSESPPRRIQTQDPSPSRSPSLKVPPKQNPAAEESTRTHTKAKMKLPLKPTQNPHRSKLKAKEKVVVVDQQPIGVGKGNEVKRGGASIRNKQKAELHQTTASGSGVHKKSKETQERTMMFAIATSNPSGKDIKLTDPVINNVATISNEEKPPPIMQQEGIKNDVSNLVNKLATVNPMTQPMDDKTVSVVTLAGDNKGATMHVANSNPQSTRKKGSIQIHRAYRTNQEESTEEEEKSRGTSAEKDEAGKAYVNSNIQSANNSIMLHGSINGRDPGVRVILPQQQHEHEDKPRLDQNRNKEPEANNTTSRAERLTYQPMVRRRCLRGLFLEPSDSDPDKPRRHGCKFTCGEVRKDKDTDIL